MNTPEPVANVNPPEQPPKRRLKKRHYLLMATVAVFAMAAWDVHKESVANETYSAFAAACDGKPVPEAARSKGSTRGVLFRRDEEPQWRVTLQMMPGGFMATDIDDVGFVACATRNRKTPSVRARSKLTSKPRLCASKIDQGDQHASAAGGPLRRPLSLVKFQRARGRCGQILGLV